MDRKQFLKDIWKAYPAILSRDPTDRFGRVKSLESEVLEVASWEGDWRLPFGSFCSGEHPHWGPSVPLNCLMVGDWIGFHGPTQSLHLLSPCLKTMSSLNETRDWFHFLDKVESWFVSCGFEKVRTPFLVTSPGVDHHIDFLKVQGLQTLNNWYLPTSPEMSLKKLLTQGFEKIFEVKNCFRDDWPGPHHKTEFTMLEWYRSFATLEDLMGDVKSLICEILGHEQDFEIRSLAQCFSFHLGFNLTPRTTRSELLELAQSCRVHIAFDDDWNDLFFRIFMEKIEPHLGIEKPVFITQFPSTQASLSQLDSSGWSQRFELYWEGVELANAYLEENDPFKNRAVFQKQESLRRDKRAPLAPWDGEYFEALQEGMPPCCGIALGLDRLYKILRPKIKNKD